jgi:hypothetical protein
MINYDALAREVVERAKQERNFEVDIQGHSPSRVFDMMETIIFDGVNVTTSNDILIVRSNVVTPSKITKNG